MDMFGLWIHFLCEINRYYNQANKILIIIIIVIGIIIIIVIIIIIITGKEIGGEEKKITLFTLTFLDLYSCLSPQGHSRSLNLIKIQDTGQLYKNKRLQWSLYMS